MRIIILSIATFLLCSHGFAEEIENPRSFKLSKHCEQSVIGFNHTIRETSEKIVRSFRTLAGSDQPLTSDMILAAAANAAVVEGVDSVLAQRPLSEHQVNALNQRCQLIDWSNKLPLSR